MKAPAIRIAAAGLLACSSLASAEITGNVTLTSDYIFRGISQTDHDPAIQGGFDFAHDSGFYAGTWGSNVNFGDEDPAHLELDVYAGFGRELAMGLGWDVGVIRYIYPNTSGLDYDFTELYAGLSYGVFGLAYAYSDDFFGGSGRAHHLRASLAYELAQGFTLGAHVGHQSIRDNESFGTPDYTYYGVSVGKEYAGLDLELSFHDTDLNENECFAGTDLCDGRLVLSVSRSL